MDSMKLCLECNIILPGGYTRKFCSIKCFRADMDRYWNKPRVKKRWHKPITTPLPKPRYKVDHSLHIERDLKRLEHLLIVDGVDLE